LIEGSEKKNLKYDRERKKEFKGKVKSKGKGKRLEYKRTTNIELKAKNVARGVIIGRSMVGEKFLFGARWWGVKMVFRLIYRAHSFG
jgi:hypothetical protein